MKHIYSSLCIKVAFLAAFILCVGCNDSGVNTSPCAAPTGVNAEAASSDEISISWTEVPGATAYVLYRDNAVLCTLSAIEYHDRDLAPNTAYSYQIAALNESGLSTLTPAVSATTLMICPRNNSCSQLAIVYPNGGEILHVGDTCKIKIHADSVMELVIRLVMSDGLVDLSVGQSRDMKVPRDSIFNFVIPDSSYASDMTMYSTNSDSCLIRAYWYNNSWCYDESDCYFAIRP